MRDEKGLYAVQQEYGPEIASRMRRWPEIAYNATKGTALGYGEPEDQAEERAREARGWARAALTKAKKDRRYALEQAAIIADHADDLGEPLDMVESWEQIAKRIAAHEKATADFYAAHYAAERAGTDRRDPS